jgi:hypothetical protein
VNETAPCKSEEPTSDQVIGLSAQSSSARFGDKEVTNGEGRMGIKLKNLKAQKDFHVKVSIE